MLIIPDITEGKKLDKFTDRLRFDVRVEVLKSTDTTLEEAARVALRVDVAMWKGPEGHQNRENRFSSTPIPMEIGNLE